MRPALWWELLLLVLGFSLLVAASAFITYCLLYSRIRTWKRILGTAEQAENGPTNFRHYRFKEDSELSDDLLAVEDEDESKAEHIHHAHQPVPRPITQVPCGDSASTTASITLGSPLTPVQLASTSGMRKGVCIKPNATSTRNCGRPRSSSVH